MKLKKALEGKYKLTAILILVVVTIVILTISLIKGTTQNGTLDSDYTITDNSIMSLTHLNSNSTLTLEVASTPQKRESGLMFRKSLKKDSGMIFIFPSEMDLSFWMKNTSISLDMIFLDKDLKVTSIYNNTKILQTEEFYDSKSPSQFVIETLAGWAQSEGVRVGDLFKIASIK